jgi:predicted HD phosphohydrolase
MASDLSIDAMTALLTAGAHRPLVIDTSTADDSPGSGAAEVPSVAAGPPATMAFTHLDHALQTAAVLRQSHPDDIELQVAGLVHDIGHLVEGGTDPTHAEDGASAVRAALGERVSGLVGLHVQAKRYLVAEQADYALAPDSVVSLALQGGPMTPAEMAAFAALPLADDACALRLADESGKVDGLEVPGLDAWVPFLRRLAARA